MAEKETKAHRVKSKEVKELDEKFKYQGKEFDAPPAHPNCRSTLRFIQVK